MSKVEYAKFINHTKLRSEAHALEAYPKYLVQAKIKVVVEKFEQHSIANPTVTPNLHKTNTPVPSLADGWLIVTPKKRIRTNITPKASKTKHASATPSPNPIFIIPPLSNLNERGDDMDDVFLDLDQIEHTTMSTESSKKRKLDAPLPHFPLVQNNILGPRYWIYLIIAMTLRMAELFSYVPPSGKELKETQAT
ncbi:hypothetical protein Cgig2_018792 [Carnegiea gigantea]|uniref:Uncharacterized protein n=1 Tax=Carnegiea gigantea TaxID=171969 RepID=A0A9Q1QDM7_9CARY|nr:hypothetical protein Cgig2_018792 [Carnegiea gigantea]